MLFKNHSTFLVLLIISKIKSNKKHANKTKICGNKAVFYKCNFYGKDYDSLSICNSSDINDYLDLYDFSSDSSSKGIETQKKKKSKDKKSRKNKCNNKNYSEKHSICLIKPAGKNENHCSMQLKGSEELEGIKESGRSSGKEDDVQKEILTGSNPIYDFMMSPLGENNLILDIHTERKTNIWGKGLNSSFNKNYPDNPLKNNPDDFLKNEKKSKKHDEPFHSEAIEPNKAKVEDLSMIKLDTERSLLKKEGMKVKRYENSSSDTENSMHTTDIPSSENKIEVDSFPTYSNSSSAEKNLTPIPVKDNSLIKVGKRSVSTSSSSISSDSNHSTDLN